MLSVLFIVFAFSLASLSLSSSTTSSSSDLLVYGPSFARSLFDSLATAFSYSHQKRVSYQSISDNDERQLDTLVANSEAVVVESLDINFFALNNDEEEDQKLLMFPLYGYPFVLVFNVGDIKEVFLSQQVLMDIFLGRISKWNDEKIIEINQNVFFPNETITRIGSTNLFKHLTEGLSAMANETIKIDMLMLNDTIVVEDAAVCAKVSITPNAIGFSWMADALVNSAKMASIQNKDGFYASPIDGVSNALTEYHAARFAAIASATAKATVNQSDIDDGDDDAKLVLPHNMPGRLSYPLIGLLFLILPSEISPCTKLENVQDFVSLMLSQKEALTVAEFLGWESMTPALSLLDYSLGSIESNFDYVGDLHSITCESREIQELFHTIGATNKLWPFVLKILIAYSQYNSKMVLSSSNLNITTLIQNIIEGEMESNVDVDLVMTWSPVLSTYQQQLYNVPVFMGALACVINLGKFVGYSSFSSSDINNPQSSNISEVSLILSAPLLVAIFSGEITMWNDTQIKNFNPLRNNLPNEPIQVLASPRGQPDGPTAIFAQWLEGVNHSFSWERDVKITVKNEENIIDMLSFTPWSIGYMFAHELEGQLVEIPQLLSYSSSSSSFMDTTTTPTTTTSSSSSSSLPLTLSSSSLSACWISSSHPECWPLAVPLSFGYLRLLQSDENKTCEHQKISVDFVDWLLNKQTIPLDTFLLPNTNINNNYIKSIFDSAAMCDGRNLLYTIPEPQILSYGARMTVYGFCGIGLILSFFQLTSLLCARNNSELRSASVTFSIFSITGILLMFIAPFLIVQDDITTLECSFSVWLLSFGFTFVFGSLFVKLYRLYKIFTSRNLIAPRLSDRKLFILLLVFFIIDFVFLIIYSLSTPAEPENFSSFIASESDLVSGQRELTWKLCSFHPLSGALVILLLFKMVIALGGTGMAFVLRKVDRRFTAISALGYAFYNLFIMVGIVVIFMMFAQKISNVAVGLYVCVFGGIWILYITLIALIVDSNIFHACRGYTLPLRKLINKDYKERLGRPKQQQQPNSANSQDQDDSGHHSRNNSNSQNNNNSAINENNNNNALFVMNRGMFPQEYNNFHDEFLSQILDELTFQRQAVRRALAQIKGATDISLATQTIDTSEIGIGERQRGSTKVENPSKYRTQSKSVIVDDSKSQPQQQVTFLQQQQQQQFLDSSDRAPSQVSFGDYSSQPTSKLNELEMLDISDRTPRVLTEARSFPNNDNLDSPNSSVRPKILTERIAGNSDNNRESSSNYQRIARAYSTDIPSPTGSVSPRGSHGSVSPSSRKMDVPVPLTNEVASPLTITAVSNQPANLSEENNSNSPTIENHSRD